MDIKTGQEIKVTDAYQVAQVVTVTEVEGDRIYFEADGMTGWVTEDQILADVDKVAAWTTWDYVGKD